MLSSCIISILGRYTMGKISKIKATLRIYVQYIMTARASPRLRVNLVCSYRRDPLHRSSLSDDIARATLDRHYFFAIHPLRPCSSHEIQANRSRTTLPISLRLHDSSARLYYGQDNRQPRAGNILSIRIRGLYPLGWRIPGQNTLTLEH